jgi:hypothetical protein
MTLRNGAGYLKLMDISGSIPERDVCSEMTSVFHRNSADFVLGFVNSAAPGCVADVSGGHAISTCHIPCSTLLLGWTAPSPPASGSEETPTYTT